MTLSEICRYEKTFVELSPRNHLSPGTADIVPQLPLRRLGTPEEVAEMIYVLCSDQAAYVTGAELHINGGQHV